jgi:tetratricopeptide (TPR) repeat protein
MARIYQNHRRWDEAIGAWREALGRFPGHVGMTLDFAFCLQSRGDTVLAEREVRGLLESHPDQPQALNFLGYLLAEANRNLKEAETMIRRALERDPDNGAFVDSMGWVFYRLGRLDEARRELERATRLTDGDAVVREHLGDVYRDLRLHDLAREQYRRALDARGDGARLRTKLEGLPR